MPYSIPAAVPFSGVLDAPVNRTLLAAPASTRVSTYGVAGYVPGSVWLNADAHSAKTGDGHTPVLDGGQ